MDISYKTNGMFTNFYPESADGHAIWLEMCDQYDGTASVLTFQAKSIIAQIRAAGYKVAKAKPVKMSDDELLAALGV